MTGKAKTIASAVASGILGYLAYFIALPPSLQTGIMGDLIALLPASYQTAGAGITRTISTLLGFYTTYRLAKAKG